MSLLPRNGLISLVTFTFRPSCLERKKATYGLDRSQWQA